MDSKTAIAVVTNRGLKAQTVLSLLELEKPQNTVYIIATLGYTIAENRSYAVLQALKENCTHILFVDDDMTFPKDTLTRLLAHEKEIIGVWSHSRKLPLTPTVSFLKDGKHLPHDQIPRFVRPEALFECYSIGMGVALIDLSVFEKISKPYFEFQNHESGKNLVGEDAWFCREARSKGYSIYCDPTLTIGHIGEYIY